jgi:hypothetical protein
MARTLHDSVDRVQFAAMSGMSKQMLNGAFVETLWRGCQLVRRV